MGSRAVFLDRDGVLVIPDFRDGRSFAPKRLEDFRFYPDALQSVEALKAAGYLVLVVTNQPDVGAGIVDRSVVEAMHERLLRELPVDDIEVCYHTRQDDCECRKPKPGMITRAARRHAIDCANSIMVGDRASDVDAGRAAGCRTIFIDLGYRDENPDRPDHVVSSLGEAAAVILKLQHNHHVEGAAT
jgi:D-glycero-D-manno-heptose 1,7-bisphosphate phosphatase